MKNVHAKNSTGTLTSKEIIKYTTYFFLTFLFLNVGFRLIKFYIPSADIPAHWPISESILRILCLLGYNLECSFDFATVIVASLIYGFFFILILKKVNNLDNPYKIYFAGVIAIFLSNFIQGIQGGFVYPVSGGEIQYYHDAVKIGNALDFINKYNTLQPYLFVHSSTHPPGAVLIFYLLDSIFPNQIFISLVLMVTSLLSIFYIYKLSLLYFSKEIASFTALIFVFLPAVQIYYLSCLDSLISLAFLGLIYHYLVLEKNQKLPEWVKFGFFLFFSFSLTYLAIFPLSLIILNLIRNKNTNMIIVIIGILSIFFASNLLLGYNYIMGFKLASYLENPHGFRLFSDPASYLATRFEDVAEILLFFGPISIVMAYRGLKGKQNELIKLSIVAIVLLIIFFIGGVARTGETARCCLFIYPFLLFLVANYINSSAFNLNDKRKFLTVLWLQSIVMQIVGFYSW